MNPPVSLAPRSSSPEIAKTSLRTVGPLSHFGDGGRKGGLPLIPEADVSCDGGGGGG
jgi:hypothetical protein